MIGIGDVFKLDLREIFFDGFDEGLRGTPGFDEVPLTYGSVTWVGDGDVPGAGGYDSYDWKVELFGRIPCESGWLELRVVDVDEYEGYVEGELVGWCGLPKVKLSFDEFECYAR